MEREEWLLEQTCRDLQGAANSNNEYRLLQASGSIRQLLIDGDCLMDAANRIHRLPIKFRVAGRDPDFLARSEGAGVFHWSLVDAIDPDLAPPAPFRPIHDLKRDKFLAFPIGRAHAVTYTVRDLIDLVANKMGGRHLDRALDEQQQLILEIMDSIRPLMALIPQPLLGMHVIAGVRGISSVVLKGLQPLRDAIHAAAAAGAK